MVSVFPGAAQLIKNQCLSNPVSLATEGINQDMTIPLFSTPSICPPCFLRSSWLTSRFLGDFAVKSPALFCFKPPPQITTKPQEMVWALWSSVWWWNFWRMVSHPFNYHEKRLLTCFSSWPELKKQLHVWMGETVPSPSKFQRSQDVSSQFSIISHWIAPWGESHSFSAEVPVSNDTWDFCGSTSEDA